MLLSLRKITICIWRFPSMMHSEKPDGCKQPKLYVSYNGCDHNNIAPRTVHIKNHPSYLVYMSLVMSLMSQDRSAAGIGAFRYCGTPVLANHRDDKPSDDRIRHVPIVIYCSWTSSLAQASENYWQL